MSTVVTPTYGGTYAPLGMEIAIRDCEVEGRIPEDLNGGFYTTGPDLQYPLAPGNISFDGEGHVRVFRFRNGHVDYRTRFVRTERYVAQDRARRILMPMYRNPSLDDPSVRGLSRGTANTAVIHHRGLLLAMKEDSPPAALNLETLETIDPVYTFDGQLRRDQPFTAHPKVCSTTGNMVAFGTEAHGFGSEEIAVFEIDREGRMIWSTEVTPPHVGMIHDFAVTEHYIAFFVGPITIDHEQMGRGGVHFSWDGTRKSYLGVMRRHGDGKDMRWIEGPTQGGSHTMGAFDDKGIFYFDREITRGNQYMVIPHKDGSVFDPAAANSLIHRLSVDMNRPDGGVRTELLSTLNVPLPRQDDRYHTVPYRYAFAGCPDPDDPVRWKPVCYIRMDHATRTNTLWKAPKHVSLGEPLFVPKSVDAREGEGWLLGVGWHHDECLRSDLYVFDAEHLADGPMATVRLPVQASPQIHGWWVPDEVIGTRAPVAQRH